MSATQRLPVIAGTLTLGAAMAAASSSSSIRQRLLKYVSQRARTRMWWLLGLLLALINFKNLPFLWHFRVFRGILYQLHFQTRPLPPSHLFAPIITSSRNTLFDTDYNFHKSNSTYFADLDVSRAHCMGAIIRTGLQRLNSGDRIGLPDESGQKQSGAAPIPFGSANGRYVIALGGVACHFHKQIEMGQAFEIWTRVLSWDRKWLYFVSHVVKKGAVKPEKYVLQPWKRGAAVPKTKKTGEGAEAKQEDYSKAIFATSIARYVVKRGRLTINPEIILERSRLLPTRPEGVGFPPRSEAASSSEQTPTPTATHADGEALTSPESVATAVSSRLGSGEAAEESASRVPEGDAEWTWDMMEKERLRGLKFAQHFDGLSGLQGELKTEEALGRYKDFLF